jgi:hypothetical protein
LPIASKEATTADDDAIAVPSPLPAGDVVVALGTVWAAADHSTMQAHGLEVSQAIAAGLLPSNALATCSRCSQSLRLT